MHLGGIGNLDLVLGGVLKAAGRSRVDGCSICLVRVWCLTLSVDLRELGERGIPPHQL